MKSKLLFIYFILLSGYSFCQQKIHIPANGCRFDLTEMPGNVDVNVYEPDDNVQRIWNNLLSVSGTTGINAHLKKSPKREFESFVTNGSAWVVYNPDLLNEWENSPNFKWIASFILAHELGHIALQHNLADGSNKDWEARADEWACQQLCKMSATPEQAKQGILTFVPADKGIKEGYPTKRERIEGIDAYFASNNCGNKSGKDSVNNKKKLIDKLEKVKLDKWNVNLKLGK